MNTENLTFDDKIEKCNMISAKSNMSNQKKLRRIVYLLTSKKEEYEPSDIYCPSCGHSLYYVDETVNLDNCVKIIVDDTDTISYDWYCPYCNNHIFTADYYTHPEGKTVQSMLVDRRNNIYKELQGYSKIYYSLKEEYTKVVNMIWQIENGFS